MPNRSQLHDSAFFQHNRFGQEYMDKIVDDECQRYEGEL